MQPTRENPGPEGQVADPVRSTFPVAVVIPVDLDAVIDRLLPQVFVDRHNQPLLGVLVDEIAYVSDAVHRQKRVVIPAGFVLNV